MAALELHVDLVAGRRARATVHLAGDLHDPNTGHPRAARRASAASVVEEAVATAWGLHRTGDWRHDLGARLAALNRFADALDEHAGGAAEAESLDTGVPIAVTAATTGSVAETFRAAVAAARTTPLRSDLVGGAGPVVQHRMPWGPVAAIVPWNAPAPIAAGKVAAALAAGCPVVLKPSEWAPSAAARMADAAVTADLPAGAFQVVHGDGDVGAGLVGDPRIRAVTFTGSVATGRTIVRRSAAHLPALELELSGNNPVLIRSDADVDATATALAAGIIRLNGQWCEGPGRVLVHRRLADELRDALLDRLADPGIGHSLDPATRMGPLSHRAHLQRLRDQLAGLRAAGGHIHQPARLPDLGGWFLAPTVITGVDPVSATDEIFGPVVTLHAVVDDEEALALANDRPDGLAAYVFTDDVAAGLDLGAELQAGEVRVNGTGLTDLAPGAQQSFFGTSGIGGHGGDPFAFFTGARVVGVDDSAAPI